MVKILLFALLAISQPLFAAKLPTWPEGLEKNLESKSIHESFCKKPVGVRTKEACLHFAKEKSSTDLKLKAVSVKGHVLTISDGVLSLEIKRLMNPNQFEINHKVLDMEMLQDFESLNSAVDASIPKTTFNSPWWFSSAYAKFSNTEDKMKKIAIYIAGYTSDREICYATEKFIRLCQKSLENTEDAPAMANLINISVRAKSSEMPMAKEEQQMLGMQLLDLKIRLEGLRQVLNVVRTKGHAIIACDQSLDEDENEPAEEKETPYSKFMKCSEKIRKITFELAESARLLGEKNAQVVNDIKKSITELKGIEKEPAKIFKIKPEDVPAQFRGAK